MIGSNPLARSAAVRSLSALCATVLAVAATAPCARAQSSDRLAGYVDSVQNRDPEEVWRSEAGFRLDDSWVAELLKRVL